MGWASLGAGPFWHLPKASGTFWQVPAFSACFCSVVAVRCSPEGGAALRERRGLPVLGSLLKLEYSDSGVAVAVADCSQKVFSQPMGFSLHVAQTSWV